MNHVIMFLFKGISSFTIPLYVANSIFVLVCHLNAPGADICVVHCKPSY